MIYPGVLVPCGKGILRVTSRDLVSLVQVKMDLTGAVRFNGRTLTKNQLAVAVKQEFDRLPPELRTLTIRAPKNIRYGKVAECLDGLQKTGVKRTKLVLDDIPEE